MGVSCYGCRKVARSWLLRKSGGVGRGGSGCMGFYRGWIWWGRGVLGLVVGVLGGGLILTGHGVGPCGKMAGGMKEGF